MAGLAALDSAFYDAIVVISPGLQDGELKDQDRGRWFGAAGVACLADGVSSSPFGGEAAQMAVDFGPAICAENVRERLGALRDLLIAKRLEAQHSLPLPFAHSNRNMRSLLDEVTKEKMTAAFQTTLVAARLVPGNEVVTVDMVQCGDSAAFAFSASGELLFSTLSSPRPADCPGERPDEPGARYGIPFGPGDEVLIKIIGTAADRRDLTEDIGIRPRNASQWLVCRHLDGCGDRRPTVSHDYDRRGRLLGENDVLLVPRYLIGRVAVSEAGKYLRLRFSELIKVIGLGSPAVPGISFRGKGSITAVLPDHVDTGRWSHVREFFPLHTQFLLASDGFYEAFEDPGELWKWLQVHKASLRAKPDVNKVMEQVHDRLRNGAGDDDASFVWVFPTSSRAITRTSSKGEVERHVR